MLYCSVHVQYCNLQNCEIGGGGFKINVSVLCDSATFLVSNWLNNFITL